MSLKEKVFQNHVSVILRDGTEGVVVGKRIIELNHGKELYSILQYNDELYHFLLSNNDIMKATLNGEVIYDRYMVDGDKIPVNADVLVRDNINEKWRKRKFAMYLPNGKGKFIVFKDYCDLNTATNWIDLEGYKQCKLAQ